MSDDTRPISKVPGMIYGGDYNPEQWPEEVWLEDARLMRQAGVNLVSLGVFAWARLEPRPGVYDFGWLDRVMDLLHAHGVRVNLGTATPAPPPWLARLHPETLPVTADGVTLWPGSRRHYSPHSRAYREHAARLVERLAERYKDHPALALWHVDNEYACHFAEDFSPAAATAFRAWLRRRYGTLEALNAAWGSAFWGQIYAEWDEIEPPRRAPYMVNPGHQLDWKRFSSDAFLECFEEQKAILRRITPDVPITTNFMGFHKPLDYWRWAATEDVVANDAYPDPADPRWAVGAAMACDLMRSLGGGRPWILMEQAVGHVNWLQRNATKPPGMMRLGSLQAVARGADGVMFFQWRQSRAGSEQFLASIVPHSGPESRAFREVAALGAELGALAELRGSRVPARVAILFDWESWWALEIEGKPSADLRLMDQVHAFYAPLWERNITVDFARPDADLSRYALVLAPNLFLVGEVAARNLEGYVAGGGTLVMGFFSGIVDERDQVWLGGYPAPFRALLGLHVEELAPYGAGETQVVYTQDEESFACGLWSDIIALEGAEVLARYASGWFAHRPAVTRHSYGAGGAYYAGTALDEAGMGWLLARACREAGVGPALDAPAGVEVVQRAAAGRRYLFLLNHGQAAADVHLPQPARDLLRRDQPAQSSHTLEPGGVAILGE
ncbi:MAG TPA: beta-galactosidase [Roseiflexaceae bacterium]|nr:beta-galactosidase [Roseiflexaceae bacterium]